MLLIAGLEDEPEVWPEGLQVERQVVRQGE
jgi:hypothetical protein